MEPEIRLLGAGTYNCVFSYKNKTTNESYAFRLFLVPVPIERRVNARTNEYERLIEKKREQPAGVSFYELYYANLAVFWAQRGLPKVFAGSHHAFMLQYRARSMLEWLQKLAPYLGPALLRTPGFWNAFGSFDEVADYLRVEPETFNETLKECETLTKAEDHLYDESVPYMWGLEKMERLALWDPEDDQEMRVHLFGLLWFFMVLGSREGGGFRHHDLSTRNVMTRFYATPNRFRFVLDGNRIWEFEASSMGVVIDLDMASLNITTRHPADRDITGTLLFVPPEAYVVDFYEELSLEKSRLDNSLELRDPMIDAHFGDPFLMWFHAPNRRLDADGYDQWSLAMIAIGWQWNLKQGEAAVASTRYAEAILQETRFSIKEEKLQFMFAAILTTCAVLNVPVHDPFIDCPPWFPPVFFAKRRSIFTSVMQTAGFQATVVEMTKSPFYTLFRRLFAWDPQDRVGRAWLDDPVWLSMVKTEPSNAQANEASWPPPTVLEFTAKERFDLQARICASCAAPNPQTKCGGASCESAYYCGQECADAHWPAHQCTNQVHPVLSSLSHHGDARDYYASKFQNK